MTQKQTQSNAVLDIYEPHQVLALWQEIVQTSQHLMFHLITHYGMKDKIPEINVDPLDVNEAFQELSFNMMMNPLGVWEAQLNLWNQHYQVLGNVVSRALNPEVKPMIEPKRGDRRFKDENWESSPLFDYIKQAYLLTARWLDDLVTDTQFTSQDAYKAEKMTFYTRQLIDALAPSNFVATNPEVLSLTLQTGGKNLLEGMKHFLSDLERGQGKLNIKMTDLEAFELGENIATTPGKVVFQNELMQLLQYTPTTEEVYQRPLLIVPPWINKYYILDLRPKNSFIKWAVDQGHTVFVISWINPDSSYADKSFEDYMLAGPIAALDAITAATTQTEVNAIGYCIGGTLLAPTLAYMAEKKDHRIVSATYLTTLLDFTDPGELKLFIDDNQVKALESKMAEQGYLEGSDMATTFNMLRSNDLIWSFYVNNYLKGNQSSAFDLLYWNSDSTRMPAKMHSFYLRNMYLENRLKEPHGINLNGVGIDLRKIKVPAYFISTQDDHIAPWKMTFEGTNLMSGPLRFVLGGSGHIAGIINPPANNKYFYYTNKETKATKNPDTWLKNATRHEGSWWTDWAEWVALYGGEKVPARQPGEGQLSVIEDAPGSYVKIRTLPKK